MRTIIILLILASTAIAGDSGIISSIKTPMNYSVFIKRIDHHIEVVLGGIAVPAGYDPHGGPFGNPIMRDVIQECFDTHTKYVCDGNAENCSEIQTKTTECE